MGFQCNKSEIVSHQEMNLRTNMATECYGIDVHNVLRKNIEEKSGINLGPIIDGEKENVY